MRVGVNGAVGQMGRAVCAAVTADADLTLVAAVDRRSGPVRRSTTWSSLTGCRPSRRRVRRGCRLHRRRVCTDDAALAWRCTASMPLWGRPDSPMTTWRCSNRPSALRRAELPDRAELRHLCGADDAFCRDGRPLVRHRRSDRTAPHAKDRRPVRHSSENDRAHGRRARHGLRGSTPTEIEIYPGARGGAGPRNIRAHSVRMQGMVAHQEVILGAEGQTLTIRQDSYDRSSFMPGVVLACKQIHARPGLVLSLDSYLG